MPLLLALLAAAGAAIVWYTRLRTGAAMARELTDMAADVMGAARRFGFRRRAGVHPVDSLEEPDVAIAAAGIGFLELADLPTAEDRDRLTVSLQHHLGIDEARARESLVLGRWLVSEWGGPQPGFDRLVRRLVRLQGGRALEPLMVVLRDVAAREGLSDRQRDAIEAAARALKLR